MKRYLGALAEDFRSQVSAIAEQFLGLNKKVDMNTEMIGHILEDVTVLKEDMKEVKSELKGVQGEVKGIQDEMKGVKAELKTMNGRLDNIERELGDIKRELSELKKTVAGKAEQEKVLELEARILRIEEFMRSQVAQIKV
jgi:chromosome segregation ATPase